MDEYMNALYERLDQTQKPKLIVFMFSAIAELKNSGIIDNLLAGNPALFQKIHDPDENVRLLTKVLLAKDVGQGCIVQGGMEAKDGKMQYAAKVRYDPRFVQCLGLYFQGSMEGVHMSGLSMLNGGEFTYKIGVLHDKGESIAPLVDVFRNLKGFYQNFQIIIEDLVPPEPKKEETPPPAPKQPEEEPKPSEPKKKPGFWERLFGKKKAEPLQEEKPAEKPTEKPKEKPPMRPLEAFYDAMQPKAAFRKAFVLAEDEIVEEIKAGRLGLKNFTGGPMTVAEWSEMETEKRLRYILTLANHGITPSTLLCIDFEELIPYCLAIGLLYMAYTGKMEKQLLEPGCGSDTTKFEQALALLQGCCDRWSYKILKA